MIKKLDTLLVDNFQHIIFGFVTFWLSLIAFGLLNQ
jgi:hypothetical protein